LYTDGKLGGHAYREASVGTLKILTDNVNLQRQLTTPGVRNIA